MPLSEQEQRLLDEMERSLYHNDADFVASVGGARRVRPNYTALVGGVLLAVLGVAALVTGVVIQLPVVGVLGFAVMFAGVLVALGRQRRGNAGSAAFPRAARGPGRTGGRMSFMDRVNQRWDRRQGGGR